MATDREESTRIEREERQSRAMTWAKAAFTVEEATSLPQRGLRLLEEAIELFQACIWKGGGMPWPKSFAEGEAAVVVLMQQARAKAHELVDFVFARPAGEIVQELGGVSVCMLVLAEAHGTSVDTCERLELQRVLEKPIEEFTKRNAAKNAAGFLSPGLLGIIRGAHREHVLTNRYSNEHGTTRMECSCGAVFDGQNPDDEYANHIAIVQSAGVIDGRGTPARCNAWSYPGLISWNSKQENLPGGRQCVLSSKHHGEHEANYSGTFETDTFRRVPRRSPGTARELHGTTKHQVLAETICDLMYEHCSVCDMNVYGTTEKLDRCIVANMLADELAKAGLVLIEPSDHRTRIHQLEAELISARSTLQSVERNNELGKLIAQVDRPIEMFLNCPLCGARHIDVGEFATKPHHTHACQGCGLPWRPAIGPTVGVQYLPGFKNEEK